MMIGSERFIESITRRHGTVDGGTRENMIEDETGGMRAAGSAIEPGENFRKGSHCGFPGTQQRIEVASQNNGQAAYTSVPQQFGKRLGLPVAGGGPPENPTFA